MDIENEFCKPYTNVRQMYFSDMSTVDIISIYNDSCDISVMSIISTVDKLLNNYDLPILIIFYQWT